MSSNEVFCAKDGRGQKRLFLLFHLLAFSNSLGVTEAENTQLFCYRALILHGYTLFAEVPTKLLAPCKREGLIKS